MSADAEVINVRIPGRIVAAADATRKGMSGFTHMVRGRDEQCRACRGTGRVPWRAPITRDNGD